ncbi:MAG: tetratricopeptide repeat protein [Spirochaetales bacterium]|nr:tetratricopeptide repeat protein [Spirochaetales bacterium]MDY5914016.1 tetratricopeptide repeat protein [Treponema sp.]
MTEKELNLTKAQNAVLSHDWGTAARLYKLLLKDDDSNITYLKALANVYVKSNEDEKAIPYYEQIINFYPHDIEAMNSLGAIYRRIKKYQKSVEILKKAQHEQNISSVNYNLGFTFKEMGNYEDAIECFESVITENPDDVLTYNHLGSIYLLQKNYEKSVNSFKHGLQVDQNHPILNYNLARCYAESKNYRDSIKYFEKALRTRPGWIEAVRDFSDVLVKCQKNSSAQELVERTIKMHPQNADLLCILGNIFLSQFDYDNAVKTFEKAEEIEPNDVKILMGFSEALEKGDRIDEALEKAVEAADLSPLNPDVRKRYIHTLLSAQKYDQALEHVKELEETEGDDLQVLDLYGQYYICRGNEEVANLYYQKIKEKNQEYDDYILNASDRFMQTGNLDKAEEYAKKFVAKREKIPEGYNQLGQIYVAKGEWNKAKSVLEKSSTFRNPNVLAKKKLERVNTEINNNPTFAQMPSFDFSSLQKEDDIIFSQPDFGDDDFDLRKNDNSYEEAIESLSLTDSENGNINVNYETIDKNTWNEIDGEKNSNVLEDDILIEENDTNHNFNQNDLQVNDENDVKENQTVEIIESGNENEDFSTQEDDNDEVFDEKTFDFSQFGDLPGLNETLCEDDEEFWSEFDDDNVNENENSSENLTSELDETKPVRNQNNEEMDLAHIPQNFENKMNELASDAFEKMSKIVDKATEISNSEIAQKQREIENKTAVLGALNSADTALQVAMKTQQIVKNLEEKQKNFEEEFLTKSEKMIQEAVDKKFEEEAEINGVESDFADVEEFIEQEDEVTESEPEFADVDELCSQETENDVGENEFAEVSEFVEAENDDDDAENDFADVEEFIEQEDEVTESEPEFADVDELCGQKTENDVEETEFAEVSEFVEAENDDDDTESDFADVEEFIEQEDEVTESEPEFADVDELCSQETKNDVEETEFAEVSEFVEAENDDDAENDFADVEEFIEQEDEVTESEPEFADVDELCSQETENDVEETDFAEVSEFVESENDDDENTDKEDVCDFKNLRAIFEYLPENGKDSFVSNRIRMVVEYVIAKTSGKRGLLKTAKMWRKSAHLDNYEAQNDEDKVTAKEIYDLVKYLKTLANELEDKEISKAICESADNVLIRIQL